MSNKREALEAALSTYKSWLPRTAYGVVGSRDIDQARDRKLLLEAISKIEAALAEPAQEPVRWLVDNAVWERKPTTDDMQMWKDCGMKIMPTILPLYASPQPREWQELSEEDIADSLEMSKSLLNSMHMPGTPNQIYRWISSALRTKNEVNV